MTNIFSLYEPERFLIEKFFFSDIVVFESIIASKHILFLGAKFIYILIILIATILYELYLIGFYKYQDFQTNAYIESLERLNRGITLRNTDKENMNLYIRTKAYQSFVAKATQNKKLPWEEVVNVVDESLVKGSEKVDVNDMIFQIHKEEQSPTKNMKNPEKWLYIFSNAGEYF